MNDPSNFNDYAGLIFDCDGTLTDSMPQHYVAWRDTFAHYEIEFTEARFYAMAGMPTDKIVAVLAREHGKDLSPQKIADEKEEFFLSRIQGLCEKPEVCDIVRGLHGQIPMAVASGSQRHAVIAQLTHIGLIHYFEAIVASEDTERHKPEPDVFLRAAELLGVEPSGCCVFEDSDLGIRAAKSANMDYVDVRSRKFQNPK